MMDGITRQDARIGQHGRSPGALAYTVDGQGLVLHVREAAGSSATTPSMSRPALAIGSLVPAGVGAPATPSQLGRARGHDRGRVAQRLPSGGVSGQTKDNTREEIDMALTTRHAAACGAAGGLALGLIGGSIACGLYGLRHARRTLRLASQYHSRIFELERTVREKDAEIAARRAVLPPLILDEWGPVGTIPSMADRMARHKGLPALTPTALTPARAYNPPPTVADAHGDAPDPRRDR